MIVFLGLFFEVIVGFRETEKFLWMQPKNMSIVKRLIEKTASSAIQERKQETLPLMHILDLAADGWVNYWISDCMCMSLFLFCVC